MNAEDSLTLTDELDAGVETAVEDAIRLRGHLRVEHFADGELLDVQEVDNLVVTVGQNQITDQLLASPTIAKPTHMAIGTGTTAEAVGQTALVTETARVALTSKTRSGRVLTMVGDFTTGSATATEAGIFNAASAGDMGARGVFAANASATSLKITWTWQMGA